MQNGPETRGDRTQPRVTRRAALGLIAGCAGGLAARAADTASQPTTSRPTADALPTNTLGRTGVKVTRLAMGAGFPSYERRLLEAAYRNGIRFFDNAYGYGNGQQEATLGRWAVDSGRRADVFIVTKDGLCETTQFQAKVMRRLESLGVDTIDMMMIHSVEDPALPLDPDGNWWALKDRLVREKRVRFMGFSTHAPLPARVRCVAAAARSRWVDAVMVACDPLLLRTNDELNRAVDVCAKGGIGLVAMKTTRGLGLKAAQRRGLKEGEAETETMPGFDSLGLSAFGAVHYGMWSDGRFAAICSAMLNRRAIEENTRNARRFTPLGPEQQRLLEDGMKKLARATCPGCDGACQRAAGTQTDFASISRYLAYYDEDGNRQWARELYAELSPARRDAHGADLAAASKACWAGLDLEAIVTRAERCLG